MLPYGALVTHELDADLAWRLYQDIELRDQLEEKILEELKIARVTYEVHIDGLNKKVQVIVDLEDVLSLVEEAVYLFTHGEEEEDEPWSDDDPTEE